MRTLSLLTMVLAGLLSPLCAQTQSSKSSAPQASQSSKSEKKGASQDVTKPPEELQSLIKALSGKWSLAVKFEGNPAAPSGFTGQGEETWRAGPGGFTLLEEEHIPMPDGEAFLLGVIWWDATTKSFHGMECNNELQYGCDLKGALNDITISWNGSQLKINEIETHGDKKHIWHETWSDIRLTTYTQTGDVEEPDGTIKRIFTMSATRAESK